MMRKLVKTGNSDALIITKEMKEYLGVHETVSVSYAEGKIILESPTPVRMTLEEAMEYSTKRYDAAYRKLAE